MNLTTTPDSPRATSLSTSINDSNYLQQRNSTASVKRKRRKDSNTDSEMNITPNFKRFNNSNENENGLNDEILSDSFDKKDNKYLINMEIRDTERNYVTMLSNIIRVSDYKRKV
jgi:hypothetical protein